MARKRTKGSSTNSRVFVVDDHPLVRRGLVELIAGEPGLEVCGEASDADEALQHAKATQPDLIVIDISLKGTSGIELIKQIKALDIDAKMLVSSMHDESLFAERALRAGAMGYVNKEEATEKVLKAIHDVLAGRIYLSPETTDHLLRRFASSSEVPMQSPIDTLSDRELEVFALIGRGQATRQIADNLHISIKTVETYRDHIKTKLNLETGAALTRHAVQWVLENG